jgi:hypothetical protein
MAKWRYTYENDASCWVAHRPCYSYAQYWTMLSNQSLAETTSTKRLIHPISGALLFVKQDISKNNNFASYRRFASSVPSGKTKFVAC